MKKLLLILIVAASLMACRKIYPCYVCTTGTLVKEYCGTEPYLKVQLRDTAGNIIPTTCQPK